MLMHRRVLCRRSRAGFTLNELLIVVVILGILAAIALPQFSKSRKRSDRQAAAAVLEAIYHAERAYVFEHNRYVGADNWGALGMTDPDTSTVDYTLTASGSGAGATFLATASDRGTSEDLSITQTGPPATGSWQ